MKKDKFKDSLLMGALASSFGIFLSKVLGLFYYSPLSAIAGEANMAFYSIVYTYYDLLLQISSAGIPFAIASLVAKYVAKDDYKSAILVKKIGTSLVLCLSFIVGVVFIFMINPLTKQTLGASAPISDINYLKRLFYILLIAIILVPFLSSIRGYIQGLKRLDIYGASQVLEQFVRVLAIIVGAYVFVKILNLESIWAIYVAIAAASLGALIAILFTKYFSKQDSDHVVELASNQSFDASKTKKEIFIELLSIGIPYLIISFLGTAGPLVNTTFFIDYITKVKGPEIYEHAKLSSGILQANVAKISNIPSVLALGFGSGMVPYLSESLELGDNHRITRYINQILDTVCIILIPLIFIFVFYAKDIYFIMYGNNNLDLGASLFRVSCIQIFLGTIAPVFSSIMMSLKLRKDAIFALIASFIAKLFTFFPCVKYFGAYGMIYSSGVYYLLQILFYFYFLKVSFNVNVKGASKRFVLIIIASLIMVIPTSLLSLLVNFTYTSRILDILMLSIHGIIMLVIYYFVTKKMGLLSKIFELDDVSITSLVKRLRR